MRVRWFIAVKIILSLLPIPLLAGTGVEGRVELPKSHAAPVMVWFEGDGLRFETEPESRKFKNLLRNTRVAVTVFGPP